MSSVIKTIGPSSPLFGKASPGERIVSINGSEIMDVLDYKYHAYDARLILDLESADGVRRRVRVKKEAGADLGIEFDSYLMDKAHSCCNKCVFCFVDQLPRGLRRTLYFKDDDARLSFLTGNYITLTNLTEHEIERICALKISPVNISVHSTNPELRAWMLGNPKGAHGLEVMERLAGAGIKMDCQIVCCPGLNDGAELRRSMEDLAALYPQVNSVSIVPVGLTKHREKLYPLAPFDAQKASEVIDMVEGFASLCLVRYGSRIFFCADELYLKAGKELPPDEAYEEYSQLENGVGMLRLLETEFMAELRFTEPDEGVKKPFSIATGAAAEGFLKKLLLTAAKKCDKIDGKVYSIKNDFFGHTIDVAGLVTGGDLIAQLEGKSLGKRLLIPQTMLRHGEGVFLDDVTLAQAEAELGVPVRPVPQDGGALLRAMLAL